MDEVKMRPLTEKQYSKVSFRREMRNLSYVEKVHCVIEMQKRLAPIMAARGKIIKPWGDDDFELRKVATYE